MVALVDCSWIDNPPLPLSLHTMNDIDKILDEIKARNQQAIATTITTQRSLGDVPPLVQALRRALLTIDNALNRSSDITDQKRSWKCYEDIADILAGKEHHERSR